MSRISIPGGGLPPFYPDATLALDFLTGAYRVGAGASSRPDFASLPNLTVTRATPAVSYDTTGTYSFAANVARIVPGVGLLVEERRINLFLNSFAPATQSVTITAASHTITVWGTGSVTVAAGTATISNAGAASAGSPRTIGCTGAGTITVTVTGSPSIVQVEAGTFGTSPIPTLGASVTRAADGVSIGSQAPTSPYTVYVESMMGGGQDATRFPRMFQIDDGSENNKATLYRTNSSGLMGFDVLSGGVTQVNATLGAGTLGAVFKNAARIATNDYSDSLNGAAVVTDASVTVPTVTTMRLGSASSAGQEFDGYIRKLVVYPVGMTNAQLIAMTS